MRQIELGTAAPLTDGLQYTNRCFCGRALTKLEVLRAIQRGSKQRGVCPCGSNRFYPSNFKWWERWFLIRSWRLLRAIRRGELPPPPTAKELARLHGRAVEVVAELLEPEEEPAEFGFLPPQARRVLK